MHPLNMGKLQYALFDMKQTWFKNVLQLIIYLLHCNYLNEHPVIVTLQEK